MNKLTRIAAGVAIATSGAMASSTALAEMSYNVGYVSEYHFRGIKQKDSSASAGADFETGGFYAGTWAADVGDGLEVDFYGGYGIETESGITASLGFTGYYYTGEFDDTYEEINLNLGYSMIGFEYSVGTYENFGGPEQDYDFMALSLDVGNGFYGTYGTFGDDFDGDYIEVGYGTTVADVDLGIAFIYASDELSDETDSAGLPSEAESLVFSLGKSF